MNRSFSWEYVTEGAANAIVDTPPQCLLDSTHTPGISTMHVYVNDYLVNCLFEDELLEPVASEETKL